MTILQAESLRKRYGRLTAVDDISFSIEKGECFGLLGPNGAGKSTTIGMLYGYTPRDSGSLTLFGLDIDRGIREIKARIGICQQENSLDPDVSVRENLEDCVSPPLFEPLLYILAFGLGLSTMVGELNIAGKPITYTGFIAPALIAVAIMHNSFFETTYNSFVRMYYQKTYDALLATPLNLEEIILGEMLWAATKSLIAAILMGTVLSLCGLLTFPGSLLIPFCAILGGLCFAAMGMICTALVPGIETFNIPIFLGITPMFLFSGTFFPLQNLPGWAQTVAQFLPLTHLVRLVRSAGLQLWSNDLWFSLLYLLVATLLLLPLAIALMVRRIVQ